MADCKFVPERLTTARQRRRLRRNELASAIGVTPRSISLYENDGKEPAAETMDRIVDVLGFRREFFFQPPVELPREDRASFRATTTLSARDRDQGLAATVLANDLMKVIHEEFEVPEVDVPDLSDHPPEVAAELLRSAWGLGDGPLPHTVELAESHGIRVFSIGAGGQKLDAFAVWQDDEPYIMMALPFDGGRTLRKSPEAIRFTVAHEIGHLVLHRDSKPQGRVAEREADRFAAAFLMPESTIRRTLGVTDFRRFIPDDVLNHKAHWLVSLSSFVKRLHTLGFLSDWQYKDAFIDMSSRGMLKREPSPCLTKPEVSRVVDNFARTLVEERRWVEVSRHLGWGVEELNGMLFNSLPIVHHGEGVVLDEHAFPPPALRLVR